MKTSKLLWLFLLAGTWMAPGAPPLLAQGGQSYTLQGQVKLDRIGSQSVAQSLQLPPRLTIRFYFPKDMKKPVLLAYVDGEGKFYFQNIPGGSYLIELYLGSQMIYQKAVTVSTNTNLDDDAMSLKTGQAGGGSSSVFAKTRLMQGSKVVLSGDAFQSKLTLSVGVIRSNRTLTIKIYETRGGRVVAKKDHQGDVYLEFNYQNNTYVVKGYPELGRTNYLQFEIYRKNL